MEIKLPLGSVVSHANTLQNVAPEVPMSAAAVAVGKVQEAKSDANAAEPDKNTIQDILKRTSELVSILDRNLKFEVVDDAGIVQIQVIDSSDGRVVRKIPSDEVLKLVSYIKEKMSERVDVKA